MIDMRRLINICESEAGHNRAPEVRLTKTGKTTLGTKMHDVYKVMVGDRPVGTAYGRYTAPKPGSAGGHSFQMTINGKDFSGSKARLIAWIETMTRDDI